MFTESSEWLFKAGRRLRKWTMTANGYAMSFKGNGNVLIVTVVDDCTTP